MTWNPQQIVFADTTLPPLRGDITLLPGPAAPDGSSTWTLHDAPANRFYRIGMIEYAIIACWKEGTPRKMMSKVNAQLPYEIDEEHIKQVLDFLENHHLVHAVAADKKAKMMAVTKLGNQKNWKKLAQMMMSIRIPLFRCDATLTKCLPYVNRLYSMKVLYAFLIAAAGAIILLLRHWGEFTHTFSYFFNVQGLLIMSATVICCQALHELGHAFTAKRLGLRVPSIGLSFFMFCPVLYTDTNEVWKLPSRWQRIMVGISGVAVEMGIAIIAAYFWVFLDDGPLRTAAFMIVSVNFLTTLLVNMNPLMRFDGYYVFSDIINIENLQDRAFAMMKWFTRERLVGLKYPAPETLGRKYDLILIIYGYSLLIYRIGLYGGMVYTLYHLVFKLLGIAFLLGGIYYFFITPVVKEFQWYWLQRERIHWNLNSKVSVLVATIIFAFFLIPWKASIQAPAVLRSEQEFSAYSPRPAQVQRLLIKNGQQVKKDDILLILADPSLDKDIATTEVEVARLVYQIRGAGSEEEWQMKHRVLEEDVKAKQAKLTGLKQEKLRLIVRAPFAGVITDVKSALKEGEWIGIDDKLAMVIDPSHPIVEAYINEHDMEKMKSGAEGIFRSLHGPSGVDLVLKRVDISSTQLLDSRYLVSDFGGKIAAVSNQKGQFQPHDTIYRVILKPTAANFATSHVYRGLLVLEGQHHSILGGAISKMITTLIKEVGF
ncbi:MAG: HlyD family efflux transporter periplasmic adaptor subunit [Alphaproteobacteria bacterium]|nr:HlyD family efflux transporter periplasmic adaptor subunit [Alphaproteobacteria bacterium]